MPLLGNLLIGLLAGLVSGAAQLVGKKAAAAVALVAGTAAAFAVCYLALNALISAAAVSAPVFVAVPMSWILPDNLSACIAARLSAGLAVFAYRWHLNIMLAASAA